MRRYLAVLFGMAGVLAAGPAAASDVSSWLSVGGGYGLNHDQTSGVYARATTMSLAVGVGTDPTRSFVVGGLLRDTTYLSVGTDLGIAARVATGGFARGQWGLALDAGPTWRSFGSGQYGRWPISAMLTLGAPWGLQLSAGGTFARIAGDDASARGFVAVLEIDLLRLTVMRQGATDRWWHNPSPAGGRPTQAALPGLLW